MIFERLDVRLYHDVNRTAESARWRRDDTGGVSRAGPTSAPAFSQWSPTPNATLADATLVVLAYTMIAAIAGFGIIRADRFGSFDNLSVFTFVLALIAVCPVHALQLALLYAQPGRRLTLLVAALMGAGCAAIAVVWAAAKLASTMGWIANAGFSTALAVAISSANALEAWGAARGRLVLTQPWDRGLGTAVLAEALPVIMALPFAALLVASGGDFGAKAGLAWLIVRGVGAAVCLAVARACGADAEAAGAQPLLRGFADFGEGALTLARDGRVLDAGGAIVDLLGVSAPHLVGRNIFEWVSQDCQKAMRDAIAATRTGTVQAIEFAHAGPGGQRWLELKMVRQGTPSAPVVCGIVRDVSDRRERESALLAAKLAAEIEAEQDPLTRLPNRRTFDRRLRQAVAGRALDKALGLILFDVDLLKAVNDQPGHSAGDAVLRRVGSIARQVTRPLDVLARLSGDEFAILLPGADRTAAGTVAQRLWDAIAHDRANGHIPISVSVGAATWRAGQSGIDLFEAADEALYAAKRGGRNRIVVA